MNPPSRKSKSTGLRNERMAKSDEFPTQPADTMKIKKPIESLILHAARSEGHSGCRPGGALQRADKSFQSGGKAQRRPLSTRLPVSIDRAGMEQLEVTNCDFKCGSHSKRGCSAELVTICDQFQTTSGAAYRPIAFTEHGAIMAATVLNSPEAVAMSVFVVRAFVQIREHLAANAAVLKRLAEIDRTLLEHDSALRDVYRKLLPHAATAARTAQTPHRLQPRHRINFHHAALQPFQIRRKGAGRTENINGSRRWAKSAPDNYYQLG